MALPRRWPPLRLYPDMLRAALWRAVVPLLVFWRSTWFYRQLLKGPIAYRLRFHPYDALPAPLEDAEAALRGRFRFCGESVEVKDGSVFEQPAPSAAWGRALQSFAWLPPLAAAGGEPARVLATNLISQWLKRNAKYSVPAWSPEVLGRRLLNLFAHSRLVMTDSDLMWRSKLFVSLREQSRALARTCAEAPEGLPRLEAAAALVLSGVCLQDHGNRLEAGLARLESELAGQILPDGGHISRSPEALVTAYRYLTMVMDGLQAISYDVPQAVRVAHDRMTPMIRFFRHGDGTLALFNGGTESDARMIAGLLARDEVRGQPFGHAPHSGYQRAAAGKTILIVDCGTPPPGPYSCAAHAGCLSFEFSTSGQRVVVNCGSAQTQQQRWENVLRATAAHSTVTLADMSSGAILPEGVARNLLGPRLIDGSERVDTRRVETTQGVIVEGSHDGYAATLGIVHERSLTLAPQGRMLTGLDRLVPKVRSRDPVAFAIRFHVHPNVRLSASQGAGILLKLPNGEGWRFRAQGGGVAIEESVYLGGESARRTEQLVIVGSVRDAPVEIGWVFEQIGAQ
ncbi:MAG TPA: heparinase II/III family protein [Rhizomicrobium sp.]|jgi:uncharacterized heparinase superfamily protein